MHSGERQKQKQTAGEVRCIREGTPNKRELPWQREPDTWRNDSLGKNKNKSSRVTGQNIQWETQPEDLHIHCLLETHF